MRLGKLLRLAASAALLCACVNFGGSRAAATGKRAPRRARPGAQAPKPAAVKFKPACAKPKYPSPAPSASPEIDSECGLNGAGAGPEGAQDAVKNNFCATGATPRAVTVASLTGLQAQVEKNASINFGSAARGSRKKGPTTDRAPLKKLGEGQLVSLRAYILTARPEGPESVNCKTGVADKPAFHDIHISLVASADVTDECSGVVAEMSPHHRPDSWSHVNLDKVARAQLPVRVTGQLYFDSSHFPCANGQSAGAGNPKRVSLWEVHPIYKFEVCTAGCDGAGTWQTLDEWAKSQ
ncbi:MAG TPA: hypothetical protein VF508_08050 [Pyrinomonadaceae bacterium]|jgi:hypothetical protein